MNLCSKQELETLLQSQEEAGYQKILQGRANQCFFLEIFPTHNDKT